MPGIDHLRTACIAAARYSAGYVVRTLEGAFGHAVAAAHMEALALEAENAAAAAIAADLNFAGHLTAALAAWDARYAAGGGVVPPLINNGDIKVAMGATYTYSIYGGVRVDEAAHGKAARGIARSLAAADSGGLQTLLTAELNGFLADMDARYTAGTQPAPQGTSMDECRDAILDVVTHAASAAALVVEQRMGHYDSAHFVPILNQAIADGRAGATVIVTDQLGLLCVKWDLRYQAHA